MGGLWLWISSTKSALQGRHSREGGPKFDPIFELELRLISFFSFPAGSTPSEVCESEEVVEGLPFYKLAEVAEHYEEGRKVGQCQGQSGSPRPRLQPHNLLSFLPSLPDLGLF